MSTEPMPDTLDERMSTKDEESPTPDPPLIFRKKKPKAIRQRVAEPAQSTTRTNDNPESQGGSAELAREEDGESVSVAEILKLRRRNRLKGVEFRAEKPSAEDGEENDARDLVARDAHEAEVVVGGITRRFAPQTGFIGDLVNKHMMEYVESKLAKRSTSAQPSRPATQPPGHSGPSNSAATHLAPAPLPPPSLLEAQKPTMHGKLMEIDLGEEARARAVALTEKAKRRLTGQPIDEEDDSNRRHKKPRLGKDGKPWRGRNRRGSDDVKRDQMVEAFLHENRLDVYDVPQHQTGDSAEHEGGAADDRIAEEFQREFMDAMAQRRKRKRTQQPARPGDKKADGDVLKGPKLGGSRNVRAQMRDILLKKEKESMGKR